jgi:hypothetical protein
MRDNVAQKPSLSCSVNYLQPGGWIIYFPNAELKRTEGEKTGWKFYFFRFGLLASFLAVFEDGGGAVFNIFRNPSSKLTPGNFRFNDLPMRFECG